MIGDGDMPPTLAQYRAWAKTATRHYTDQGGIGSHTASKRTLDAGLSAHHTNHQPDRTLDPTLPRASDRRNRGGRRSYRTRKETA